jgi:hypothetical protein
LSADQLIGRERFVGCGQQLGAAQIERMGQHDLDGQARLIDFGGSEALDGGLAERRE